MSGIFSFLSQRFLKGQVIINSKHKFIFLIFKYLFIFGCAKSSLLHADFF